MVTARSRFRALLAQPGCTDAAPVFDPFSARVAEMNGWKTAKLSGSFAKMANVSAPDGLPLSNMTDLADICRRIARNVDFPLVVDADEGGGNAITLRSTIRDLEMAGVAAIEIEDNLVPQSRGEAVRRHALMVPLEEQVGKLRAAVAARRDSETMIVARSFALSELPRPEALRRLSAYAQTGAEAVMIAEMPGGPADLIEVANATALPLFVLGVPQHERDDPEFVRRTGLKLRFLPHRPFRAALTAMNEAYQALREGTATPDPTLNPQTSGLIDLLCRKEALAGWESDYLAG
jgi:carboxyvinyl-carboxyphosphonate phosphorylmutase